MSELMAVQGMLWAFLVSLLIFGFAPGFVLSLIVRMIPDLDRRRELQAELYDVPRWEQPYWVVQQFEVAIRLGLMPRASWYWGRHVWHRHKVQSGVKLNQQYPDSFEIPSDEDKHSLLPGDLVKLTWSVKRSPGERMWVTILHRDGEKFTGQLRNWPAYVHLDHGDMVRFTADDIIDCMYVEDEMYDCHNCGECHEVDDLGTVGVRPVHEGCNSPDPELIGDGYPDERDDEAG